MKTISFFLISAFCLLAAPAAALAQEAGPVAVSSAAAPAPAIATGTAPVIAVSSPVVVQYEPPRPSAHAQRLLESAADLSRDLAETVAYLEAGQTYFRLFTKATHTSAENKLFVKFLAEYEGELDTAKKEAGVLRDWLDKASALK